MSISIARLGHNNPPSQIELTRAAMSDLSGFLGGNPTITDQSVSEGALYVERGRKALQDLEDARKKETGPLNEQVKSINEQYRSVRDPMDNVLSELRRRLTDHTAREEAKRIRAAEEARRAAELAEMEARIAEQKERDTKTNASFGEVTNVAAAVVEADQAFSAFQKLDRAASIAERNTHVKLPSQLGGKALGLRSKETLMLDNAAEAFAAISDADGITENGLYEAILTAARTYRKRYGRLPSGVRAETTRSI